MRKLWKRSLSLFLSLVLVLGLMPTGLTVKAEEAVDPAKDLNKANGIVWLTKNEAGDNVSDEFSNMVQNKLLLDDMVRESLGITDPNTKVYFKGVDVGSLMELMKNQDTIEELLEEMEDSISNQYLVNFTINGATQKIAFRNLKAAEIVVGEDNKIYIDHKGAPESAAALEAMVSDKLANTQVSVTHTGTVTATGIKNTGNKAQYVGSDLVISNKQTYANLVAKWPTISSGLEERKAGTVTVTIYAAEYDEKDPQEKFKESVSVDVILRDTGRATVTVNAVAKNGDENVQDDELSGYEYSYQAYIGDDMKADLAPVMDNYRAIGWESELPAKVTGDATYTAVMEAKIDNNGNGLADQNEVFTITYLDDNGVQIDAPISVKYGEDTPEVTKPTAPEGKKYIWKVYDAATGLVYGSWQPTVNSDVIYKAVLLEGPSVTGTLKFRGQTSAPVELTTYLANLETNDGYKVEDPSWEALAKDDYKCTGWYILDPYSPDAQDLNRDGVAAEVPFTMDSDIVYTANGSVELYYEFFTTKYDGYWADGTEWSPVYNYEVNVNGVTKKIELGEDLGEVDESLFPAVKLGKYQRFGGWNYVLTQTEGFIYTYSVEPIIIEIESKVSVDSTVDTMIGTGYVSAYEVVEDGVLRYTWTKAADDYYEAYVEISGMTSVLSRAIGAGDFNYLYDENTEIKVSPIWKISGNSKKIAFYVDSLSIEQGSIFGGYENYEVYNEMGKFADPADPEVTLAIGYKPANFKLKDTPDSVAVGQESYSEKEVYEAIVNTSEVNGIKYAPDYDADEVTVQYLAREKEDVEIDLYLLYELFEAEGLGVVLNSVGGLPETYTIPLTEKWLSVSADVSSEKTAQEITDAYIAKAYAEQKAEKFTNIEDFINDFLPELVDEIDANAIHKFGNNVNGDTEEVKIAYRGEKYYADAYVDNLPLEDDRIDTYFTVDGSVSVFYGEDANAKVLENVTLYDKNGNVITGVELITKNGEDVRDYSHAGTGIYNNVVVSFKGNDQYQPATSAAFTLEVKKVNPTVTVEELLAVQKGTDYYSDAAATVTPNAPIVQIVAGIAVQELAFDSELKLADDEIVIDAWVKLPKTYTELLDGLNLGDLNGMVDGVSLPSTTVKVGVYYEKEHLKDVLEEYLTKGEIKGASTIQQILDVMDQIPESVLSRLGMEDMEYTLRIRLDALEDKVYPTEAGFYVNYAATLSKFTAQMGSVDKNYGIADDYGFIVISPMLPIPNRGGVQLYDGEVSNAQNVFVYEYNGEKIARDLEVAIDGVKVDDKPFYYGLTTRFDATKQVPNTPGVYFAGYIYTDEVYNEDADEMEVRRLGSDSAVIIIKQREVDLEIKGGTYEYDGDKHMAEVIVKDKKGTVLNDAAVTVISGTANVNASTNVSIDDLYGTVNIDFPDALQNEWDAYCKKHWGENAKDKFAPSDVISFLEECADAAEARANGALDEFEKYAIRDTVSSALDKINAEQNRVDVSSGNLVNNAERVRDLMQGGRAYFDKLIEELEPLKDYDNNVFVTFYDLEDEADKLGYDKTGYYLYVGVTTDPDLTVDAGKALVIIHSADDYIMRDTHVPYDGQPHNIFLEDETSRGDVTVVLYPSEDGVVAINREKKEVRIQVDNELAQVVCEALNKIFEKDLNVNSGTSVGAVYTKTENVAVELTKEIMDYVRPRAIAKVSASYPEAGAPLDNALAMLEVKLDGIYADLLAKLQEVDTLDNDTQIIISDICSFDLGTYEVTTFDFNVNEINIQLDGDLFKALKVALEKKGYQLTAGSDGYVITGYEKFEDAADVLTEAVFEEITKKVRAAFDKTSYDKPEDLENVENALEILENKILSLEDRFAAKLQQVDGFDNYTRIVINGKLPVDVGTYEFYGYDYDVSATRGTLVIEPIYIFVDDEYTWKYVGEADPELPVVVGYYSYSGVAPESVEQVGAVLPEGVTAADLVSYTVSREAGEEIGVYDIIVNATLLDNSGNYILLVGEDGDDFEIAPIVGTIGLGKWKMNLDSVVYLHYYPEISGFSPEFDFTEDAGVVIWTGANAPTSRRQLEVGKPNTMVIEGWRQNEEGEWYIRTHEIYAKNLGDMVYVRPFVVDHDGSYVYLDGAPYYSPELFSYDIMNASSASEGEKNVCAALLQYGASAQIYFGHKVDSLMTEVPAKFTNVDWNDYTEILEFKAEYENAIVLDDHVKALAKTLARNGENNKVGVSYNDAVIDLAGAVRFSTGFDIDTTIIDVDKIAKAEVLFWNERDFAEIDSLEYQYHNYNFKYDLKKATGNETVNIGGYRAQSDHIVAKYLGESVYFTCRIEMTDGTVYNSGLAYYSPEAFVGDHIRTSTGQVVTVCERIMVYSEMAKRLFLDN